MEQERFANELRQLAFQAEAVVMAAPSIKDLPPALTAGITDAVLRLSDLLSLLAHEIELLNPEEVYHDSHWAERAEGRGRIS